MPGRSGCGVPAPALPGWHTHLMAWVILIVSGLLEAGWALSLKASDGLSKLWPSVAFFVLLAASMAGLMIALKTLPVGPA